MKNKYQEALNEFIENVFYRPSQRTKAKASTMSQHEEYYVNKFKNAIQELIDKETPMKRKQVEKWGSIKDCCPKCNNVVSPICCYCDHCGQKFLRLDWSDE